MSNDDQDRRNQNDVRIRFDHVKDFTVAVTEELIDLCTDGALSIEVWGHRSLGFTGYNLLQLVTTCYNPLLDSIIINQIIKSIKSNGFLI